jgi:hypothetical protein
MEFFFFTVKLHVISKNVGVKISSNSKVNIVTRLNGSRNRTRLSPSNFCGSTKLNQGSFQPLVQRVSRIESKIFLIITAIVSP